MHRYLKQRCSLTQATYLLPSVADIHNCCRLLSHYHTGKRDERIVKLSDSRAWLQARPEYNEVLARLTPLTTIDSIGREYCA